MVDGYGWTTSGPCLEEHALTHVDEQVPTTARVVVIGGGAVGTSVAYHLAKLGVDEVILLEQGSLSCGTTWHAAGIVGQLRSTSSMTALARYSIELYADLERETELSTGWRQCGALWVARTPDRVVHLKRALAQAAAYGSKGELIDPKEAQRIYPHLNIDDLLCAAWLPEDGTVNPTDLTQALAKGARRRGVQIFEQTKVSSIEVDRGAIKAVVTDRGRIECESVALCAGMWSKAIADTIGVTVPLYPAQHFYVVTDQIEGIHRETPILRDPDGFIYFKPEVGGLVMGSLEPNALPWVPSSEIPEPFQFQLLTEDWDHFAPMLENAAHRVPAMAEVGLKKLINGPESFTPDNSFLLGETPEVAGLYVAAGFNSGGIANAGGAGLALAEWMAAGEPTRNLWSVDIRRFAPFARSDSWLRDRTIETLGLHYALPWPNREMQSGRGVRRSPVHHLLETAGASFGSKLGWERVNWFASPGQSTDPVYSFGRPGWHDNVAREHLATREAVGLFDQTSFAKYVVKGKGAQQVLQRLCANDVALEPGRLVYTPVLNQRGGFESDVTITRISDVEFLIVTGSSQQTRDFDYFARRIGPAEHAEIVDVTSSYAVFCVMGPNSRSLLSRVGDADFSKDSFPFAASQLVPIQGVPVRATRMSFVGELGWELFVPVEGAVAVYEELLRAGADLGLVQAGYYAIDSLRVEKGYRVWGRDITPDITPIEAGLARHCKLDSDIDFVGRPALERQLANGVEKRLAEFRLDDTDAQLWGGETVVHNGQRIGSVTSAVFGHTVGSTVGIALLTSDGEPFAGGPEEFTIDAGTDSYRATSAALSRP